MMECCIAKEDTVTGKKYFAWYIDISNIFVRKLNIAKRNHLRLFMFLEFIPQVTGKILCIAEEPNEEDIEAQVLIDCGAHIN